MSVILLSRGKPWASTKNSISHISKMADNRKRNYSDDCKKKKRGRSSSLEFF